jgi:hypothetical protein
METITEIKEYRTKLLLNNMLHDIGIEDANLKKDAEQIIHKMLEHNSRLAPFTLVKASIFFAESRYSQISLDMLEKIGKNGKRGNSWTSLIPVIKMVAKDVA